MAKNERATTSRRAKPSPQQVSAQIARAMRAHNLVERACLERAHQVQRAERRVAVAAQAAAVETARLAATCGSVQTTASILSLEPDEVRRLIQRAHRSKQPRSSAHHHR